MKLSATFITMFKEPILAFLNSSLVLRAIEKDLISAEVISILEEANFDHHAIDDTPYGGGPGELMKINIIEPLIKKALGKNLRARDKKRVILLDPAGTTFDQQEAMRLSSYEELIFIS